MIALSELSLSEDSPPPFLLLHLRDDRTKCEGRSQEIALDIKAEPLALDYDFSRKVAGKWRGAAKNILDLNIIVIDSLTPALHQWALHYVLFGAICTAFSFDARQDASHYTAAAGGVACWTLTTVWVCPTVCICGGGFLAERTDLIFVNCHITTRLGSLSTYLTWLQFRVGYGSQDRKCR